MTAQTRSDQTDNPALGILGAGPLAQLLQTRAQEAGLQATVATDAGSLTGCQAIWILDPADLGRDRPSIPAATIITGLIPASPLPAAIAVVRLTDPERPGSLAEVVPATGEHHAGSGIIGRQAQLLGYETVVLAGNSDSFAHRVSHALMIEAMALLGDGVAPEKIEQAASEFGMAEPPLAMLDRLSLSVMDEALHAELHALEHSHADHGGHDHHEGHAHSHDHDHDHDHHHDHGHDHGGHHHHAVQSQRFPEGAVYVLEKMAHGFDRMGAESGYGFYDHEEDGSRELWDGLSVFSRGARDVTDPDITDRLVYAQAVETLKCLAEQLLTPEDADAASIAGWGFPAQTGGIHSWIASTGRQKVERRAAELAQNYGTRFQPAG